MTPPVIRLPGRTVPFRKLHPGHRSLSPSPSSTRRLAAATTRAHHDHERTTRTHTPKGCLTIETSSCWSVCSEPMWRLQVALDLDLGHAEGDRPQMGLDNNKPQATGLGFQWSG
jgi:hypothetical protein